MEKYPLSTEDESFIVKHQDFAGILRNPDKLADFLQSPVIALVETITGAVASGPKEWTLATGRIVQAALKAKLFPQVAAEIEDFRKKGKIPEDFAERPKGFQTWVELFTIIDEETPDEDRLEALKAMFLAVNRVNATDAVRIEAYQLFKIAKKLSSNDLMVLKLANEVRLGSSLNGNSYREWADKLSNSSGNLLRGLIDLADQNLVEYRLLSERLGSTNEAVRFGPMINQTNSRMTDLGMKFCENINRYHVDKNS